MKRKYCNFLFCCALIYFLIQCGCVPLVENWEPLPINTSAQLAKMVDYRGEMLAVGIIYRNGEIFFTTPISTKYPFDNLTNQFRSQQYVFGMVNSGVGYVSCMVAMLLIGGDGVIYDIDVSDGDPEYPDYDLKFNRAELSSAWQAEFMEAMCKPTWSVAGLYRGNPDCRKHLWYLSSIACLNPQKMSWLEPKQALPIVKSFLQRHPLPPPVKEACWVDYWKPRFTPDVYCRKHQLPPFSSEQVLTLREEEIPGNNDLRLVLSNGIKKHYFFEIESDIKKALRSGKYRVFVYCHEPSFKGDPERAGLASDLRHLAKKYHVPFLILSPSDSEDSAPEYPGIPGKMRRYWQCAECD